ncbi:MAG: hypothetical protein ACREUU_09420 [Gammaproteobacteria bacterium]
MQDPLCIAWKAAAHFCLGLMFTLSTPAAGAQGQADPAALDDGATLEEVRSRIRDV